MNQQHHAYPALPEGYKEYFLVDLKANKQQNVIVNVWALVLALVAFIPALIARHDALVNHEITLPQWVAVLVMGIAYILLHEAVHGVMFWHYSGQKPSFGLSWQYAYAGSEAYYRKGAYLVVALAPVVLWDLVLAIAAAVVPANWFWPVHFIQIMNISGAGGDMYVTWKFLHMPENILVQDSGIRMAVYAPDSDA